MRYFNLTEARSLIRSVFTFLNVYSSGKLLILIDKPIISLTKGLYDVKKLSCIYLECLFNVNVILRSHHFSLQIRITSILVYSLVIYSHEGKFSENKFCHLCLIVMLGTS